MQPCSRVSYFSSPSPQPLGLITDPLWGCGTPMLCCPGDTEDLVASHARASEGPCRDLVYPPLTKPSKTLGGGGEPHPYENGISQQKSSLGGHCGLLQPGRHKHLSRCIFVLFSPHSTEGTHGWDHPLLITLQYPTKGSSHHPKTPLSPSAPHNRQPWRALNSHRTLHPCLSPGRHPQRLSIPPQKAQRGHEVWETIF